MNRSGIAVYPFCAVMLCKGIDSCQRHRV